MKKIKVLIIDDSVVFRELLARALSKDAEIQVVAKAENPFEAAQMIENFDPDVITCDVNMPKMNGIEFIRQLLPQHPVPVIVISGVGDAVFDALDVGAVDFVTKPSEASGSHFFDEIVQKVKIASKAKVGVHLLNKVETKHHLVPSDHTRLIAIGASTGGTEAINKILSALPPQIPGIVIVQHIPPMFSKMFAERLNHQTDFEVMEGQTGQRVLPGRVIIAPGDRHMSISRQGDGYKTEVFYGDKVNGHCPSVDVMFESLARIPKLDAMGIILTGMGYDGAKGLLAMRRKNAFTVGQDERSCVVYGMPKVAYEVGAVMKQLPIEEIPRAIMQWVKR